MAGRAFARGSLRASLALARSKTRLYHRTQFVANGGPISNFASALENAICRSVHLRLAVVGSRASTATLWGLSTWPKSVFQFPPTLSRISDCERMREEESKDWREEGSERSVQVRPKVST